MPRVRIGSLLGVVALIWLFVALLAFSVNAQPAGAVVYCPSGWLTAASGSTGNGDAVNWLNARGVDKLYLNYRAPAASDCDVTFFRSLDYGVSWLSETDGDEATVANETVQKSVDEVTGYYKATIANCAAPEVIYINYECGPAMNSRGN